MELLQGLARGPIPNLLVVAGIVFLFLAVGGQLGARLVTSGVRRQAAGGVGAVLLLAGVSLNWVARSQAAVVPTPRTGDMRCETRTVPEGESTEALDAELVLKVGEVSDYLEKLTIMPATMPQVRKRFTKLSEGASYEVTLADVDGDPVHYSIRVVELKDRRGWEIGYSDKVVLEICEKR